ncbi:MAG: hypothetical protein IPL65_19450 [Lewinellaceae bacterium]|nr:hypothetical protein [Lewinellaceae bacterium]
MAVDISTPFLRRCMNNGYQVQYCNQGTDVAENVQITVEFDGFLNVMASSHPWSSVTGNTYTFDVGSVEPGECRSFTVQVNVDCAAELGQTHCSTASITPADLCGQTNPQWDGANLVITGECVNGEVVFTITNTGSDMLVPVDYVIIEDIMIQMVGNSLQLASGESQNITLPANGSTWRLEVEQTPFHPLQAAISAAVEACGQNQSGNFSLGIITQFPYNNGGFSDVDCVQNIGSFDPNDKAGFPSGVTAQHWVPLGQEIDYKIRFQNTGTDTAFRVIVLDTLSQWLDPITVKPGASSHPYRFEMAENGALKFTFDNIMLPDSNVNEMASHGFVHFTVKPKENAGNGTTINNQAAIYFDYNLPVLTNNTLHTLGEQYLNISKLPKNKSPARHLNLTHPSWSPVCICSVSKKTVKK